MLYKDRYMDSLFNQTLGEVLKKKREERNLSLEQLANRLDNEVSRQTLSTYESARSKIRIDMFLKVCKALNYDPNEIYDEVTVLFFKKSNFKEL